MSHVPIASSAAAQPIAAGAPPGDLLAGPALPSVVIDGLPDAIERYRSGYAVVVVDVIRATTTLATAVALGRRCYVAPSVEHAWRRAGELERPLLAGELAGDMPPRFDLQNSPSALALRTDIERPLVLVSSSGTGLLHRARQCDAVYLACLRNYRATASHLAARHAQVALLAACSRGEFREEDQICCAWVAERLMQLGYACPDARTAELVARWKDAPADACRVSRSAAYLARSRQLADLEFILAHVNDLDSVFTLADDEVVPLEHCAL